MEHFFSELANSSEFEEFAVILRELSGIVIGLEHPEDISLSKSFFSESEMNPLCQMIRSTPQGKAACRETDLVYSKNAAQEKHGIRYLCHAGLVDFSVPIYIENQHVATISCGQILPESPSEEGFKKLCQRLTGPIDADKLKQAYFQSQFMPIDRIEKVFKLLLFFSRYFCEMGRRLKVAHENRKYPEVYKAVDFIQQNFRKPISFSEVCSYVYLSESYFSRLLKKVTGDTFTELLQKIRIGESKKLLEKTDCTITKIAYKVGFSSPAYFYQTFKKLENCSPRNYRNRIRTTA